MSVNSKGCGAASYPLFIFKAQCIFCLVDNGDTFDFYLTCFFVISK